MSHPQCGGRGCWAMEVWWRARRSMGVWFRRVSISGIWSAFFGRLDSRCDWDNRPPFSVEECSREGGCPIRSAVGLFSLVLSSITFEKILNSWMKNRNVHGLRGMNFWKSVGALTSCS